MTAEFNLVASVSFIAHVGSLTLSWLTDSLEQNRNLIIMRNYLVIMR